MLEGMISFNLWAYKLLSDIFSKESSFFSISGKMGFIILVIVFGRLYKASFIVAEFRPFVCSIFYNPTLLSISNTVSFSILLKDLVVSFVLVTSF